MSQLGLRSVLRLLWALACVLPLSRLQAAEPVDLYFYPPPYEFPNGEIVSTVVTFNARQSTVLFPKISEMAGIVLLVNWSELCPAENACDYSVIDQVLDYWQKQGKQVILGVPAVNFPIQRWRADGEAIELATPSWLLSQIDTFQQEVNLIAPVRPITPPRKIMATLPVYWDPRFINAKQTLAFDLARRYDGHPAISKVRIDTGIVTEDNPTFDGLHTTLPGWTNSRWVEYCNRMVDIYHGAFKKSPLEFDIDRMGFLSAIGTPQEKAAADYLMAKMESLGIFLAMDGFDTVNIDDWHKGKPSGPGHSLAYTAARHQHGFPVGVEGAPMFNPRLQDVETLAGAIREVGASRLVLFSDFTAMISYERDGPNDANRTWIRLLGEPAHGTLLAHSKTLLQRLTAPQ